MTRFSWFLILALLLTAREAWAQPAQPELLATPTKSSLRALAVVSDQVVWASGTQGTVIKSTDGGKTWTVFLVPGMEKADFRSLYAFDEQRAVIANVGSPGHVLRTDDGGKTWVKVFSHHDPQTFIDGIDFWDDQEGVIYGDPIGGQMLLLHTRDGGRSWQPVPTAPKLEPGEASFAASGTGIRCVGQHEIFLCTGGTVTRLWRSKDVGQTWEYSQPPLIQGGTSTGIFSVAVNGRWIVVGGDFQHEQLNSRHQAYSDDEGKTWKVPKVSTRGYREGVEYLGEGVWVAVGPTGIDHSMDDGITWSGLSDIQGLHVVRKADAGKRVFAAGAEGAVVRVR